MPYDTDPAPARRPTDPAPARRPTDPAPARRSTSAAVRRRPRTAAAGPAGRQEPDGPVAGPWIDDPYAHALGTGRGPLYLRRLFPPAPPHAAAGEGRLLPLDVERWCAAPDAVDTGVLDRCTGPVLDVGCGPGRLVAALAARGVRALGVDVSPAAVARTRRRGGTALRRSVFDRLPGEGRWGTVLLMDGNVGIGGDPVALLARLRTVAAPGSRLLAEAARGDVDEHLTVRVEDAHGRHGRPFPWARLGATALRRAAETAGWSVTDRWTAQERPFLELRRPPPPGRPTAAGRHGHP
ncbi:methyltransferase domain-containing protein [Streptomyces similanensis]